MPRVNPEILVWARETAGLTPEEAARRNQSLRDTRNASAVDRLNALEYGLDEPSRPVLVEMARVYHRPLLTFYLPNPPAKGDRGVDFRTLPADRSATDEARLDTLIRDVRARQSMVRAVLEDMDEARPLAFVGSHRREDGPAAVLASLRTLLDVDLADFRRQRTPTAAFGLLRAGAENAGVFVLLKGNLGTHHTDIDTDVFRGFTIADDVAPFVIINPNDARPALSFTLLHEIAHLLLGQTGVSSAHTDNDIERFCDDVAGEFLLPAEELNRLTLDDKDDLSTVSGQIGLFANQSNLSRTMVAYRAYQRDLISSEIYRRLSSIYREQWREERANLRAQARSNAGGPSYYIVRRYGLSPSLVDLARRAISSGDLTTSKAAQVLGVKPSQVGSLFDAGRAS
ncbi:MAG: ImmA/IrrE family metallo-endopeptidase [Chloroflexota bacterium]|nr:ImmA/IrrE family metallo-endopeptidase [Chloroflexota bacterium]MDE2961509.1 ImmA/IrrE family metallo-endopeptidase [Chloroflexota bacterium]